MVLLETQKLTSIKGTKITRYASKMRRISFFLRDTAHSSLREIG